MPTRTTTTRLAAAGVAVLATMAGVVTTAGPAAAYTPDAGLTNAIGNQRDWIWLGARPLYDANFATTLGNPDGLPGPDGTPDGRGAFQFYRGSVDIGAIYSHRHNGNVRIGVVYGGILDGWARSGYETGTYGYPIGMEHATPNGVGGCRNAQRAQEFRNGNRVYTACWNFSTGFSWSSIAGIIHHG